MSGLGRKRGGTTVTAVVWLLTVLATAPLGALPVSVMVYNIRHERLDSGDRSWETRRELYRRVVEDHQPDILAVQEASERQRRHVLEDMPEFAYRDPGHDHQNPVFYDQRRFTVIDSGLLWISTTPEVPDSVDWDPVEPRTVYWVGLVDTERGTRLWVFNTHLDYRSERSREAGMELIYERIERIDPDDQVLIVGDFNTHIRDEIFQPLWRDPSTSDAAVLRHGPFEEAMLAIDAESEWYGTWHDWTGEGDLFRIDFIISSRGLRPTEARIDRRRIDGLWPSDHFPVSAVLEYLP